MIHIQYLKRSWLFAILDSLSVFISFFLAVYIRLSLPIPVFSGLLSENYYVNYSLFWPVLGCALFFCLSQYIMGVYDLWATSSLVAWLERLLIPNALMFGSSFAFLYLFQIFDYPRSLLLTFVFMNLALTLLWRRIYFWGVEKKQSSIVLIGAIENCQKMAKEFELPPFAGKVFVKAMFVPDSNSELSKINPQTFQQRAETATTSFPPIVAHPEGFSILPLHEFQKFSEENPYTSVIVVPSEASADSTFSEVLNAAKRGVPVYVMPTIYEILLGRLRSIQVNDLPLLELKLEPPGLLFGFLKRSIDVVLGMSMFAILIIPILIVMLCIKISSSGPIFFTQERVGFRGEVFKLIKFRTMIVDAERVSGPILASKNDPRVTKLGKFLRASRLDELPQIINILKGEMSFVGPRPERKVFVEKFEKEIAGYRERTRVRPGVTGLAQVSGSYESSAEIKLKHDLAYLAHQSIVLDFQILFKTAKIMLIRAGQ
jgi:exopolysaccharide biosynthesis polyprenyl glycosylphosphotransferase